MSSRSDLRSLVVRRAGALALLTVAWSATACVVPDDGSPIYIVSELPGPGPDVPLALSIDTDATLEAPAGDGVGVFVEYASGGVWTIWTSSDLYASGYSRDFEVIVTVLGRDTRSQALRAMEALSLEGPDSIGLYGDDSAILQVTTGDDLDGMRFEAPAGAAVELSVYVDGVSDPRVVYWVGDGILHTGAPTNPVDLVPSVP